jgi:predicted membrane protein
MEEDRRDKKEWRAVESLPGAYFRRHHSGLSHLIVGLAIVAVGVGLLLDNMGIYSIGSIWQYWPVILIALGLSKVMDSPVGGAKLWGGFLFLIGCGFLADNLHLIHFSFAIIWPLLIIYFGAMILWKNLAPGTGWACWNPDTGGRDANSDFNYTAIFGGGKRRIESKTFRGGSAVAIFGGYNIDLRDAGMAAESATIDVNALFGGIDIRVPDTWLVEMRATAIFGGSEDKTVPPRITEGQKPPRLIVTGFAAFGGIVVKS